MGNNFTAGIGRMLVIAGIFLVVLGVLFLLGEKIPGLGRLPGDIVIKREKFVFYFLCPCLLLSLLLSLCWQFSPGGEKMNLTERWDCPRTRPGRGTDPDPVEQDRGKLRVACAPGVPQPPGCCRPALLLFKSLDLAGKALTS